MIKSTSVNEVNTLLRGRVGSELYGISISEDGDRDEMGICVEPWAHFFGLRSRFEQYEYRTKPTGERSAPGDLDLVLYSLAKWAKLALSGNPTALQLLFLPDHAIVHDTVIGKNLRALAPAFVGDTIFMPFLGYMKQQREKMQKAEKGRPELMERYGFDTKYAGHLIRLGYQGIELAETGRMAFPVAEPMRSHIIDIRTGKVTKDAVLKEAEELETRLFLLKESSALSPPNTERVEDFVIETYMRAYPPIQCEKQFRTPG